MYVTVCSCSDTLIWLCNRLTSDHTVCCLNTYKMSLLLAHSFTRPLNHSTHSLTQLIQSTHSLTQLNQSTHSLTHSTHNTLDSFTHSTHNTLDSIAHSPFVSINVCCVTTEPKLDPVSAAFGLLSPTHTLPQHPFWPHNSLPSSTPYYPSLFPYASMLPHPGSGGLPTSQPMVQPLGPSKTQSQVGTTTLLMVTGFFN